MGQPAVGYCRVIGPGMIIAVGGSSVGGFRVGGCIRSQQLCLLSQHPSVAFLHSLACNRMVSWLRNRGCPYIHAASREPSACPAGAGAAAAAAAADVCPPAGVPQTANFFMLYIIFSVRLT